MKKITKVIKMSVTAIFTFIGLLFVSSLTANAAEGKELTKVVTDISVTDAGNNVVKPDTNVIIMLLLIEHTVFQQTLI